MVTASAPAPTYVGPNFSSGAHLAVTDAASPSAWDAYVDAHPAATIYHRSAWRGVFERAFRHPCHYLAATRDDHVAGILPLVEFRSRLFGRFAVSLPFVNYGGVLADDSEAAGALTTAAADLARARGWRHVELRHLEVVRPDWPSRRHKVAMWRSLESSADALWTALDRKIRNQVRKAGKSGYVVSGGGVELLDAFYRVFCRTMRDLGTPVYGKAFFAEVLAAWPDSSRVFAVSSGETPVAASIVLVWRDRVEVPWAASLREHASNAPNMLLYRAMLDWSIARGARVFDFGRSTPDEGTYRFKAQWGAEPHSMVWEYGGLDGPVPDQSPSNPKFRAAIALWQRLPVWAANLAGPPIVRNIP